MNDLEATQLTEARQRARFWKGLADILETVKPLVITAVQDQLKREENERQRFQHRDTRGR